MANISRDPENYDCLRHLRKLVVIEPMPRQDDLERAIHPNLPNGPKELAFSIVLERNPGMKWGLRYLAAGNVLTVTELKLAGAVAVHNYQMQQFPRESMLYQQQVQPGDILVRVDSETKPDQIKKAFQAEGGSIMIRVKRLPSCEVPHAQTQEGEVQQSTPVIKSRPPTGSCVTSLALVPRRSLPEQTQTQEGDVQQSTPLVQSQSRSLWSDWAPSPDPNNTRCILMAGGSHSSSGADVVAKKTKPCQWHQKGTCKFGANCRYYHEPLV